MSINWDNHIDRLRSQIADLRSTLRVIKTKAHDERPGLEQTTAQLRELVDKNESQKTLYQFPKILHKILHNPAVGAIILGPNGEHLLFNTAAERLLGSDLMADALAEKSGNFGFYQTDKITKYTKEQLPWQQAVLGEQVPEVDMFVRRQGYADGLWIKATSTALKSDTNDIGGAVVFLVDITEQVQVENQIQSTCEALEHQISAIGSAQLELQLLTEKLGKLDYLPEAAPDAVSAKPAGKQKGSSHQHKTAHETNHSQTSTQKHAADETSSKSKKAGETESSVVKAESEERDLVAADSDPSRTPQTVTENKQDKQDVEGASAYGTADSAAAFAGIDLEPPKVTSAEITANAVIDYASDELAKWEDVAPEEGSESRSTTETKSGADSAASEAADHEVQNFEAYELEAESALNESKRVLAEKAGKSKAQELKEAEEASETLEEKAKRVNESIVKQLTTEIFAIANQIEPDPVPSGHQEFFAPDSNEHTIAGPAGSQSSDIIGAPESDKLSKTAKKAPLKAVETEPSAAKRQKILIVDDIPVNQKLLRLQLKRLGFECEAANNGDAAQKAVATGDFALVLMDLDMPIMDGFESTAAIRKNELGQGRRIPIVAMTSYDRQEDRERCLAAGMDDFLSKGATQKQLHEVVERCTRAASKEPPKAPVAPPEPLKETGLDIESLQKQFDKEEVQDVSRLFLSAVNTFIDCIQLGIEEKDAGAVTHFAHSVKGPCAALGIEEMTRLTSEIMSDAEAGNWTQVRVKYMKLKSSFGEVRDQLRELCTPGYV